MSGEGVADCASSMRNGVKSLTIFIFIFIYYTLLTFFFFTPFHDF
jgi:hypothetical protein